MMSLSRVRSAAGNALRAIRHAPDRLLHAHRRRRALERLAAGKVNSALFVCLGNINRSAYAAAVFEKSVPADLHSSIRVRSAGFIGPGRPASDLAQQVAGRRSIDLSGHRSRPLDPDELRGMDLVVVMSTLQRRDIERMVGKVGNVVLLGDFDPDPIRTRTVPDPYGRPEHVFEEVFDRIDRCIAVMTSAIWPGGR